MISCCDMNMLFNEQEGEQNAQDQHIKAYINQFHSMVADRVKPLARIPASFGKAKEDDHKRE